MCLQQQVIDLSDRPAFFFFFSFSILKIQMQWLTIPALWRKVRPLK